MLEATCHCGAVRLQVPAAPAVVTECNCSLCRRRGALWAYYTTAQVRIVAGQDATTAYVWGDRCIEFHHCRTCGCTTHYRGIGPEASDRLAINARLLPLAASEPVRVRRFDGADSWQEVAGGGTWPWPAVPVAPGTVDPPESQPVPPVEP